MYKINDTWVVKPSQSVRDILTAGTEYHEGMMSYAASLTDNRSVAIDVGGCYGLTANQLAEHFDIVHSFEPHPETYKCLSLNAVPNVYTYQTGVSDVAGEKLLYYRRNDGRSSYEQPRAGVEHSVSTEVKTLDSFKFDSVGLIKYDIEGHEEKALKGSLQTIIKNKPVLIIESKAYCRSSAYTHAALLLIGYELDCIYRGKDYIYVHR